MSQLKKRLENLERQHIGGQFAPVLILNPYEIEGNRHLIGPNTVVIVDDIPKKDGCVLNVIA
jgi:hypothetical protein